MLARRPGVVGGHRDPLFVTGEAREFTDQHIAALAAGTAAAVRVSGLLTPGACASAVQALDRLPTGGYDPARVPTRIARFGPALNDYRRPTGGLNTSAYWRAAEAARLAWTEAGLRPDPITIALARLGTAWGTAIAPATIGGRPVFGGTLREINDGALIHFDEVVREFPDGIFDQQVIAHGDALLFNPANLHAVAPNRGRRIAFALFLGLTTTGNLIAWS